MKHLSVVIPVLNRAELIVRTLDSIAAQNLTSVSIIIVDNGSTDGTPAAVRRWAEAHRSASLDLILLSEPRPGASAARNCGLQAVQTPWVMFFDSDDLMLPGHLERVVAAIEAHPEADIIGWPTKTSGGKTLVFATDPWNILFRGGMATQRWAARTSLVRAVGGWDESLSVWDDIELGSRMVAVNPAVVNLSGEPGVEVTFTADSITAREQRLDVVAITNALHAMTAALPVLAPMVPFKMALVAGINRRHNVQASEELLNQAIELAPESTHSLRFIWQMARLNPPGISHITKLFITRK